MAYELEYFFECQNKECQLEFMFCKTSIKTPHPDSCPLCDSEISQRFDEMPHFSINGDVNTLGQLAEENSRKLGRYGTQETAHTIEQQNLRAREEKRRRMEENLPSGYKIVRPTEKKPWYGKLEKKINLSDDKAVKKYIEEGK